MLFPPPLLWGFTVVVALVFASFLNVCITRLPRHRSVVWPASQCPRCHAPIRVRDNIPVLSWLLLAGRCRDCRAAIPIRYLLVELAYPGLVIASAVHYGFTLPALGNAVFCFFALGLMVADIETMLLPDMLTLLGLAVGLLFAYLAPDPLGLIADPPWSARLAAVGYEALAAAAWALLLLTIRLAYYLARKRHGLGLGDVKLAAMLAAWLGPSRMTVALILGIFTAALVGAPIAVLTRAPGRAGRQSADAAQRRPWASLRLPLGAFLCGGALYAAFFGQRIANWYLSLYR